MILARFLARRRAIRQRWQADARMLVAQGERGAYYAAQRRVAAAHRAGDRGEFWHWAKVAAEVARIAPAADMDRTVVEAIRDGRE